MVKSHYVSLARLARKGSISACLHGLVHLRWKNVTVRLPIDDFRRLARLVERGRALTSSHPLCEGDLCVSLEEKDYRVAIGALELVFKAGEYLELVEMVGQATRQLESLLSKDDWPEIQPQLFDHTSLDTLTPKFSVN